MKQIFRNTLSVMLVLSMVCSLTLPAFASEALGEDLTSKIDLLHEQTQLSTNVFWSTSSSDLRTENLITYTPNDHVTPIVMSGEVLTARDGVSTAASRLEEDGYRVVAGINGDFYNISTGLPVGIVVSDGELRSSDAGYHAVGFLADGTAVLGKPGVKISASLGYGVVNNQGEYTEYVRQIMGLNKARVSTGGIYLYTHAFNDRHTTGNTEPGIDVVCEITDGQFSIGETMKLEVVQVLEATSATTIEENQVVLSVNLKSDAYHVEALRNIPVGSEITLTSTAANEEWNDVEYAVGALYSLVENGSVVSGLPAGSNPRTAIGQKTDGTLVFYTIDGRKTGYSIGASLTQVAKRLIELGCETAVCLDGGGSTTLAVTKPDEITVETVNQPSDGYERMVTNQIFLVADNTPSGRLSHFYVQTDHHYVLAGSQVNIAASAVDTNYIPMEKDYDLWASDGELIENVLITPHYDCEITVTAQNRNKTGEATIYVVETPDEITVQNGSETITSLTVVPGTEVNLSAAAIWNHLPLYASNEQFTWEFAGNCGSMKEGTFTAEAPGSGIIRLSAGNKMVEIPVTVTLLPLKTVEDFENTGTILDGRYADNAWFGRMTGSEQVRLGRGAGKLEYTLTEDRQYDAQWRAFDSTAINNRAYNSLNLWVYGDGSGNELYLIYSNGTKEYSEKTITPLDFTGWKQISVSIEGDSFEIQGLGVQAGVTYVDDGLGGMIAAYADTPRSGTVYIDHIVASFQGTVDNEVPVVTVALENHMVTAMVSDTIDGILPTEAVSVWFNGSENKGGQLGVFDYDTATGKVTFALPGPGESGGPWRVTVTAKDASGNIGRGSVDIPAYGEISGTHYFTDTDSYWAADYVDFLYTSGVTTGYEDRTFRPDQKISRQQFAVMLYRYLGLNEADYTDVVLPFADLNKIGAYAIPAIKALYSEGVINGATGKDGKLYFNPNDSLTRAQAATMIGRTQEKGYASAVLTFIDAAKIPSYATFYIQTMTAQGVIGGYQDGSFKPNNPITRGQMAKILYNLM